MDGVLVIDKPAGITSHDVVARVRRALGITRVGHTGTLDPMATGVLPLVIGRATRLARYLSASDKAYDATIRLGFATTTYDAQGQALGTGRSALGEEPELGTGHSALGGEPAGSYRPPPAVLGADVSAGAGAAKLEARRAMAAYRPEEVCEALAAFLGTHLQRPPAFSAKKVGGVPAYKRARREQSVDLPPVEVTLLSVDDVEVEGDLVRLRLVCSAGYYVRSLAHDLGEALGCGAHLAALRRTRSGEFTLAQAVTLDDVSGPAEAGARDSARRRGRPQPALDAQGTTLSAQRPQAQCPASSAQRPAPALLPLSSLLPWAPRVTLTEEGVARVRHGRGIEEAHTTGWEPGQVPSASGADLSAGAGAAKVEAQRAKAAECPVPSAQRPAPPTVVRVFSPDGRLVALATPALDGRWPLHPGVVLGFE